MPYDSLLIDRGDPQVPTVQGCRIRAALTIVLVASTFALPLHRLGLMAGISGRPPHLKRFSPTPPKRFRSTTLAVFRLVRSERGMARGSSGPRGSVRSRRPLVSEPARRGSARLSTSAWLAPSVFPLRC